MYRVTKYSRQGHKSGPSAEVVMFSVDDGLLRQPRKWINLLKSKGKMKESGRTYVDLRLTYQAIKQLCLHNPRNIAGLIIAIEKMKPCWILSAATPTSSNPTLQSKACAGLALAQSFAICSLKRRQVNVSMRLRAASRLCSWLQNEKPKLKSL